MGSTLLPSSQGAQPHLRRGHRALESPALMVPLVGRSFAGSLSSSWEDAPEGSGTLLRWHHRVLSGPLGFPNLEFRGDHLC